MTYHLPLASTVQATLSAVEQDFKSPYCSTKVITKTKEQIQKEIQEFQPLKLAPGLIKDLCQIVEDNFKDLEI